MDKKTQKTAEYWESRKINKIFNTREREIEVQRIYTESYERMLNELERVYSATNGKNFTRTELYRFAKFLSFRKQTICIAGNVGQELSKDMERTLLRAYKDAGLAAKELLGKKTVWTVANRKMAEECIKRKWAGGHFSERIWHNRGLLAKSVEQGVADCVLNGKSYNQFMNEINRNWDVSRRRTECLVRTELAHVMNSGQIETYQSEGVKYLDFDSEPTACGYCLDIEAQNPHKINNLPCIIGHPNCRCVWLPVLDDDPRLKNK